MRAWLACGADILKGCHRSPRWRDTGSIEDERLFSALSFKLTKHRCSLQQSLEKCVRLMTQDLYDIDAFPWRRAMSVWHAGASARGRYVG